MKVIKHGKNYVRYAVCDCGCEFEYDSNDTEIDKTFCFTTFPPTYKTYVKCPECGAKIFLSTMIDN